MTAENVYHPDSERIVADYLHYILEHCRGAGGREHCLGVLRALPYLNEIQRNGCSNALERAILYLDRPPHGPLPRLLNQAPHGPPPITAIR